jgi:hypothetical protein
MSLIDAVGISLSAVALLVFARLLFDVFHGGRELGFREKRPAVWFWATLLSASFLAGSYGLRLTGSAEDDRARPAFVQPVDTRWSAVRLPFYVVTRKEERARGSEWRITDRRGELQLPWPFLGGALTYLLLGRRRRNRTLGSGRATSTRNRLSLG